MLPHSQVNNKITPITESVNDNPPWKTQIRNAKTLDDIRVVFGGLFGVQIPSKENHEAQFLSILKLSADTPEELRPSDVGRVAYEAEDQGVLMEFRDWLLSGFDLMPRTRNLVFEIEEFEMPPLRKVGEKHNVMGAAAVITHAIRLDGVDYELYKDENGRGAIRGVDADSGNVFPVMERWNDFETALAEYAKMINVNGGTLKEASQESESQSPKIPHKIFIKQRKDHSRFG